MLLGFGYIGQHLCINVLQTAAARYGVHIGLQHQRHAARGVRIAVSVGLGIQIGQQKMAVGPHHIAFAHELFYISRRGICDVILMLYNVIGNINGMIISAPTEVSCRR